MMDDHASVLDSFLFKLAATVALGIGASAACLMLAHGAIAGQRAVRGGAVFADGDPAGAFPYLLNAARAGGLAALDASPMLDLGEVSTWSLDDERFRRRRPDVDLRMAEHLAFSSYAQALARRPASSYAMVGLADLVLHGSLEPGSHDALVEAAYRRAIEMEPAHPHWPVRLADFLLERGRRAEALALYGRAVALRPDLSWHPFLGSGEALPSDLFEAVRAGLTSALREGRASEEHIEASLGDLHERQGDHEAALLHYRRAIERAEDPSRDLFMAAGTLSSMGREQEALEYYRRSLAGKGLGRKQEVTALSWTGRLLLNQGRAREALEPLARARSLEPSSYAARLDLGRALEASGDPERAEIEYTQAMVLDPTAPRAYEMLIQLYRSRRDVARAIPLARRLVELRPEDPDARSQLDSLYREMNQRGKEERREPR
ncbi:MAG: tetratricopeptide repeat protein [Candidatus Polarisedimenticolia bacterium]